MQLTAHLTGAVRTLATLLCSAVLVACAAGTTDHASRIASLIDPVKLSTLAERGANPRIQKCVYWLVVARQQGQSTAAVIDKALVLAGYKNPVAAQLTQAALLRNLDIAGRLGCLDAEGLSEMRLGKAATVRRGPYQGDQLSVDHIIPRTVAPELDCVIANLELMPQRMNLSKGDRVGARQVDLARKLVKAGLLSEVARKAVEAAAQAAQDSRN